MRSRPAATRISCLSVFLLGFVALHNAKRDPVLLACLLLGMATSLGGMICRWASYQIEETRKADAPK